MTDETKHIATAAASLADPYAALSQHLHGDGDYAPTTPTCQKGSRMTTDHRSFPEAADGRPLPPMADELMSAGLSGEDARFVARMLRRDGYYLVRAGDIGWPDIHRFRSVLGAGQDHREDAGGFFVRAIMALFGKRPDHVVTYRQAATAILEGLKDDR